MELTCDRDTAKLDKVRIFIINIQNKTVVEFVVRWPNPLEKHLLAFQSFYFISSCHGQLMGSFGLNELTQLQTRVNGCGWDR